MVHVTRTFALAQGDYSITLKIVFLGSLTPLLELPEKIERKIERIQRVYRLQWTQTSFFLAILSYLWLLHT